MFIFCSDLHLPKIRIYFVYHLEREPFIQFRFQIWPLHSSLGLLLLQVLPEVWVCPGHTLSFAFGLGLGSTLRKELFFVTDSAPQMPLSEYPVLISSKYPSKAEWWVCDQLPPNVLSRAWHACWCQCRAALLYVPGGQWWGMWGPGSLGWTAACLFSRG